MRTRVYCFAAFSFFFPSMTLLAQDYPHIPVAGHNHNNRICWGYAIARAFGRDNHSVCPADPLYFGNIPSQYFNQITPFNINDVQAGDIIDFTKPGQQHVAYVRSKSGSTTTQIILDQVENENGALKTGYTLQQTIDGVPGQLQTRGQPVSYWRKKPTFKFTLQNKLGDNSNVGQVGLDYAEYNSPYTTPDFHWETNHIIDAVMHNRTHSGYVQLFQEWQQNYTSIPTPKSGTITINWNNGTPTFQAVLKNEYNITFRNQFAYVSGYPGFIIVNSNTKNSAYTEKVVDGNSITGMACSQVYNHINYSFSQWSDGNGSASRTITPGGHETYTVNFIGQPQPMTYYNLRVTSSVGQNIRLEWDEHPNSNVDQYQIWRKVKPLGGSDGTPTLEATLNRGTRVWTDNLYVMTNGYTDYLLWYDVRAHYSLENTYANSDYISVFGDISAKLADRDDDKAKLWVDSSLPAGYLISAFPNPFNPSTTIYYELAHDALVKLAIYDVYGRLIVALDESQKFVGSYSVRWSGEDAAKNKVASGIYFYKFTATPLNAKEQFQKSGKLLLTK